MFIFEEINIESRRKDMLKVLLVNDCKLENYIMRDMIINLGYEVSISSELDATLDVHDLDCNVIIANFIMKEKTGDKILKQIKEMYPKIKCILSSSNDIKLENFKRGIIDEVIHTPVTKEKLQKVLEENCELSIKHKQRVTPLFCTYCGEKIGKSLNEAK
jgi:response regulator RpfG family c-di-GMP phosphodiesterase